MERRPLHQNINYRTRFLAGLATSLAIVLVLLQYWPVSQSETQTFDSDVNPDIQAVDVVLQTQHVDVAPAPPPPPAPLPPIEVPDDTIVLDEVEDFEVLDQIGLEDGLPGNTGQVVGEGDGVASGNSNNRPTVSIGPRLVRIVTPEYTAEARRKKIRARIDVEVRIDESGKVTNPRIIGRYKLDGDGNPTPVGEIGFGVEEAALAAASRHLFRPARQDGAPVPSTYVLDMKFGIE